MPEAAGLGFFQGGAGTAVQVAAARLQHAVVGNLAGQRVREHEDAPGGVVPLTQELQLLEFPQRRLQ